MQPPAIPPEQPATGRRCSAVEHANRRRWRRLVGLSLAAGATMACLTTLVVLIQPPRPITVVAIGADYAENLSVPHNAWGWTGLQATLELAAEASADWIGGGKLYRAAREPILVDDRFDLSEATESLTGQVAVLVVSLHGGSDAEGAYLLRHGCKPSDPIENRIRLEGLLAALGSLPAEQRKLLVLDATGDPGATNYGEAENGFAKALRNLNDTVAAVPNLVVLSASDEGQRSWEEPAVGRTVFLHTFVDSLRGAACDRDQDGRLSAEELYLHVRATVSARVAVTRQRTQTPVLLPLGEEGLRRARRLELASAVTYQPRPASAPPLPVDAISSRWEAVERLHSELRCPEQTAPVAWREYRRLLIRSEQLLLSGATSAAHRVLETLGDLESILRLEAMAYGSLADPLMPPAPAADSSLIAVADAAMAALAKATQPAFEVVADKSIEATAKADQPALRRLLYDRILQRWTVAPVDDLHRSAALLEAVSSAGEALPAECQLLALLADGLPSELDDPRWPEALRLAIRVRQHAEDPLRAARPRDQSLVASTLPWLEAGYQEADRVRRLGEDLLFGGPEYLPRAIKALRSASDQYTELQADAAAIREAIRTRNRAFDLLPFYNEAVAAARAVHGDDPRAIDRLSEHVVKAWQMAHALGDLMMAADASPTRDASSLATITAARRSAQASLAATTAELRAWRSRLIDRTGAGFCNNRLAALAAPDLGVGERLQLLEVGPPNADDAATDQRSLSLCQVTQSDWRHEESRRRAALAQAAIGERLLREGSQNPQVAAVTAEAGSTTDPEAIARLVYRARQRTLARIAAAGKLGETGAVSVDDRAEMVRAASATRRLAWDVVLRLDHSTLAKLTRLKRSDYYNWRGGRVLADAWNGPTPAGPAYYQLAATAYGRLAERAVAGRPATDRLLAAAAKPLDLHLVTAKRADLVGGDTPGLAVGVRGSIDVGQAVVSVAATDGVEVLTPENAGRIVCSLAGDDPASTPSLVIGAAESPASEVAVASRSIGSVTYSGWFRGHRVTATTPVSVHRLPDVEADSPPRPDAAGVAIIGPSAADPTRLGGLVLVVDASGSMGKPTDGGLFKYAEAVETVREILAETPTGVQVSVWVFGQAIGPAKTAPAAEAAVARVLDPVRWDPSDPEALAQLMARLAYPRIEPWNESALVRTLLAASHDLDGVNGYRALIAITDGVDNRFADDAVANPQRLPIGESVRRRLDGTGVSMHVVGFRVAGAERLKAIEQFDFLTRLTPPGRWWEATEQSELADALRRVLSGKTTSPLLQRNASGIVRSVSDAFVTPRAASPVWPSEPIKPGLYALPNDRGASPQQTLLGGGDLLLLARTESAAGSSFRPVSYSATVASTKPAVETPGWRAALLNHRRLPDGSTSSLLAVERADGSASAPEAMLRMSRPSDLWIESTAADDEPSRLRWRPVDGYPAPCWEVVRDGGQSDGPRAINLWWESPDSPSTSLSIRRGAAFGEPTEIIGRSWDLAGEPVVVRTLRIEERKLPRSDGEVNKQSCLVVELEGGPRCRVRLAGVTPAGSRHAYYADAERSVAVFWPIGPEQVRDQLQGLEITSISQFKRDAERNGLTATFAELPPASSRDLRPTPSVGWFDRAGP